MTAKPKPYTAHKGGPCPVIGAPLEIQLRDGTVVVTKRPDREDWDHTGAYDDIVWWRPL